MVSIYPSDCPLRERKLKKRENDVEYNPDYAVK